VKKVVKTVKTHEKDHQLPMEKISTGKRSSAAGPKERRWTLFECGAGERRNSKTPTKLGM